VDTHEEVTVKVLLDSSITGIIIDKRIAAKHRFRLLKLEKSLIVKNVNGIYNSKEAITYQVEVNVYFKNHYQEWNRWRIEKRSNKSKYTPDIISHLNHD